MVPHRTFTTFRHVSLHASGSASGLNLADWTNEHIETPILGYKKIGAITWERYVIVYRGVPAEGWGELCGADKVMSVRTTATLLPPYYNSKPITEINFSVTCGILRYIEDAFDVDLATGKYADGVGAEWHDYPRVIFAHCPTQNPMYQYFMVADFPQTHDFWLQAWCPFSDQALCYWQSSKILSWGLQFAHNFNYVPVTAAWATGNGIFQNVQFDHVKIKYHNPVVNSLSRYSGPTAGGFPLSLYGLGLYNSEADVDEGGSSRWLFTGTSWNDMVDQVYVEDLAGNVVATLKRDGFFGGSDFADPTNAELTIRSFPALPAGLYQLRIWKEMSLPGIPIAEGYAGDWRTDAAGRMTAGERLYIRIGDEVKPPRTPVVLTKWTWKKGDNYIFRWYAPVDVRAPLTFWEGMILGMSSFTRGTNDLSGLPLFPDLDIEMDNTTQEFSMLLAQYWVKNQAVEAFLAWGDEPEAMKTFVFRGIVVDYEHPHTRWKVKLGSLLQKYLEVDLPRHRCTVDEYPNIHPDHVNREMPEVLGRASNTEGAAPGAVEAVYVDVVNFEYLGSRGSLHAVPEVYSDGVLVDPADYAVVYKDGGRTYIRFDGDQGEAKITFNAEGYMYADWNDPSSAGDYVRNPAYVLLFAIAFLAEAPDSEVDVDSFDALAAEYEAAGHGQAGYLVLQDAKSASTVVQELLFSYGAKLWPARDGRVTAGRKDVSEVAPVVTLFDQIDALAEPEKSVGFDQAVNSAPVSWEFYPTANISRGAKPASRQSSIDAFEAEIMPQSPWSFPWTTSEDLVDLRVQEELLKLGFGELRLKVAVSLEHDGELDILDTFAFQDPFALEALGAGAAAKLYYVERLTYDLLGGMVEVDAIDLQWILRQYLIAGDFYALAELWEDATETMRMYGYACDFTTEAFSDGEPGKIAGSWQGD